MSWLEPSNLLLLACALIYALIGEWVDAGILLVFVLGISLLDAVQQQRSSRALAELARLSAPRARVLRAGKTLELPPAPVLMRQPPRPPEAPLFGPEIWRRALSQGTVLVVAALVLAFWPDTDAESHRSLVFSLLLLAGGGLVWLNGDPREPITAIGPGIGLGLWLLLQALPSLQQLLNLAPLLPSEVLILLAITVIALLLAWQLAPHPPAERSP